MEVLQGFITAGYHLNGIRYADDTVFVTETEKKLRELLEKVEEERTQD